jgi:hypothetical protein
LDTLQKLDRFTKELAAEIAQAYVQSGLSLDGPMPLDRGSTYRHNANLFLVYSLISKTFSPDPSRSGSRFTNCSTS